MERKIVKNIRRINYKPKYVYNLDIQDNHNYFIENVLLHNSNNIILDESSLIPDEIYAKVYRMLGDSSDNFLAELGNPFIRNHFYDSSKDPNYNKIFIDYKRGLEESKALPYSSGVLTEEFVDEMRKKNFFGVLYACKFPEEDEVDSKGFYQLLSEDELSKAYVTDIKPIGKPKLGIDVGRGGDYTCFVLRYGNCAILLEKNKIKDLMVQVRKAIEYIKKYDIGDFDVFTDDIGIGGGVTDRLREMDYLITPVTVGGGSTIEDDTHRYSNLKAQLYIS